MALSIYFPSPYRRALTPNFSQLSFLLFPFYPFLLCSVTYKIPSLFASCFTAYEIKLWMLSLPYHSSIFCFFIPFFCLPPLSPPFSLPCRYPPFLFLFSIPALPGFSFFCCRIANCKFPGACILYTRSRHLSFLFSRPLLPFFSPFPR